MPRKDVLIKDDNEAELARLSSTNFFIDKPADKTKAVYLYEVAKREAARFGSENYLAAHYFRMSAYARTVGA